MSPQDTWDPKQYARFSDERSQPFWDLLEMTAAMLGDRRPALAMDLGCGTGELTAQMHKRLGPARTLGLDSSPKMLQEAAKFVAPGLAFELGDIAEFAIDAQKYDLILSNAALHWLPEHRALLAKLAAKLNPRGVLAVQMPSNDDHPTHTTAKSLARTDPYRAALGGWECDFPVLRPEAYSAILHELGFAKQQVRLSVYPHVLESRDEMIQWTLGTLLTEYRRRLPQDLWPKFLEDYRRELFKVVADDRPCFYPFKRILFCAVH